MSLIQTATPADTTGASIDRWITKPARVPQWRTYISQRSRRTLTRLGLPGMLAIGLMTAGASFFASVVLPLNARIEQVRDSTRQLGDRLGQEPGGTRRGALPLAVQLQEFYRLFPHQSDLTATVGKVFAAASDTGLPLLQGEYRFSEEQGGRLQRFQIQIPVKAEYPRVRAFLARLAATVPTISLEQVQFDRQKVGDPQVEATIKLAIYVERSS